MLKVANLRKNAKSSRNQLFFLNQYLLGTGKCISKFKMIDEIKKNENQNNNKIMDDTMLNIECMKLIENNNPMLICGCNDGSVVFIDLSLQNQFQCIRIAAHYANISQFIQNDSNDRISHFILFFLSFFVFICFFQTI